MAWHVNSLLDNHDYVRLHRIMTKDKLHVSSLRLPVKLLAAIEKWCKAQRGIKRPTRSDAIRYMVEQYFLKEKEQVKND